MFWNINYNVIKNESSVVLRNNIIRNMATYKGFGFKPIIKCIRSYMCSKEDVCHNCIWSINQSFTIFKEIHNFTNVKLRYVNYLQPNKTIHLNSLGIF